MRDTVKVNGHEFLVVSHVGPSPSSGVSAFCPRCDLSDSWPYAGRAVGITDDMIVTDVVGRLLARVPSGMDCADVRDWLIVQDVMES